MDLERTKYMREIRRGMVTHFNLNDLKLLTLDLGVDWDELPGDIISMKSQALINYLANQGRMEELIDLLREERPHIDWPSIPNAEQQILDIQSTDPNLRKLDQVLFLKIRDILSSDGVIHFVREHDFGGSFDVERLNDLHEFIRHLERPEFEFFDQELERLRQKLATTIEEFLLIIAKETFPIRDTKRNRIPRLYDFGTIHQKLNTFANKICDIYDELVRLGRRKLGV